MQDAEKKDHLTPDRAHLSNVPTQEKKQLSKKPTSQPSMVKSKSTNSRTRRFVYFDEYHPLFTGSLKTVSETFIEDLISEFGLWLKDLKINGLTKKSSHTIEEFLFEKGIPDSTYYDWLKRRPDLKKAHDAAVVYLGVLRESGALYGDMDRATVHKVQHEYSTTWKRALEYIARLNQATGNNMTAADALIAAIDACAKGVEKVPSSGLVPPKKATE